MYIFSRTVVETIKLLCFSVACSAIFSTMIFQEDVAPIPFVCFVLNLVSLLLFLIASFKNWQMVFSKAFTPGEYWIPVLVSYFVYALISTAMYVTASFPEIFPSISPETILNIRSTFRYAFQQTRFLEPMLNNNYSFVSFAISHVLALIALIYVPNFVRTRN